MQKLKVHWPTYNYFVLYLASVTYRYGWISHTKFLKILDRDWICNHRHSGRTRSTENNTQCFSRKNANTNDEPEIIVHVASHLQVSQIPKIKSKKGTGTWNPSRMTTFQGQSTKRHSNKKSFKSDQNQRNAIFIFITFRNHRQKILMLFHIYKCRRFRKSNKKGHQNLESQQNDNISRSVSETSLKQENLQKRSK